MPFLIALALGSLCAGAAPLVPLAVAIGGGAVAVALVLATAPRGRKSLAVVSLALGMAWGNAITTEPQPLTPGPHTATGTVYAVACDPPPRCRVVLADAEVGDSYRARRLVAWFNALETPPAPGQRVRFQAEARRPREATNPGPDLAAPRDQPVYLQAITLPEADPAAVRWSTAVALALRERLRFEDPHATAFFRAVLLGDREDLEPATRWAFQDSGTAHILAISGLHLALIGFGLRALVLAGLLRIPRLAQVRRVPALAAALTLPLVWAYTEVIAPSDATRRAFVVIALIFAGDLFARRARGRHTLALAAIVALLADPVAALRPSFQLSFAAAGALVLGAPLGRRLIAWWNEPGRVEHAIVRKLAIAVSALVVVDVLTFVATAPLTAAWFGQVSPHGLWINLVAVPLVSFVVLPVGALWALVAVTVPPLGALFEALPAWLGGAFVDGIQAAADVAGPSSVPAWPLGVAVAATLAFLTLLAVPRARGGSALVLVALAAVGALAAAPERGPLTVTALDVGHGDSLLVELPDGGAALVDAGGCWQGGVADQRQADRQVVASLLQRGVAALDVLVLTHTDRDHIGGALTVVERLAVRSLWATPCALVTPRGRALAAAVLERGGTVVPLTRHAPVWWQGVEVEVLWPPDDQVGWDGRCQVSANDASVALALRFAGRGLLLTGDIEAPSETRLVAEVPTALHADVLKAPHHGSRTSSTPPFLAAVSPSHVVVSGVPDRAPMPPHRTILERYREHGARPWITGRDGAVTARVDPAGVLTVSALRTPPPEPQPEPAWADASDPGGRP